ncbi:hypothetical protein EDC45_1340 [Mesocricetibacter intestinalis]|uniref:Uncharacterized protein n=1 Tax=Mesocricetibacter intestinalis TaxID=1521930 RepID=A0A4R6VB75_9PAST|nr:hypothetical protein EDC45_1340 [Mesocricetibacter intestinalis]
MPASPGKSKIDKNLGKKCGKKTALFLSAMFGKQVDHQHAGNN